MFAALFCEPSSRIAKFVADARDRAGAEQDKFLDICVGLKRPADRGGDRICARANVVGLDYRGRYIGPQRIPVVSIATDQRIAIEMSRYEVVAGLAVNDLTVARTYQKRVVTCIALDRCAIRSMDNHRYCLGDSAVLRDDVEAVGKYLAVGKQLHRVKAVVELIPDGGRRTVWCG